MGGDRRKSARLLGIASAVAVMWFVVIDRSLCLASENLDALSQGPSSPTRRSPVGQSSIVNTVAEIDAAKRLLKKGKVAAALKRIERVLTDDPSNQKALQLKANALRREGRFADSTQIYRLLLNHEDFDTRLGFTYALFSEGNRLAAQASADRLVPDDDSDHEELQDLRRSFTQSYRPHLSTGCDWYSDTDANQTRKCSLLSTFWLGNWKLGASYQQTEARNPESVRTADAVVFQSSRSVGEQFKLSGDFGLQTLSSGIRFPMHFRAEGQLR